MIIDPQPVPHPLDATDMAVRAIATLIAVALLAVAVVAVGALALWAASAFQALFI